jgi:hypothetical protein
MNFIEVVRCYWFVNSFQKQTILHLYLAKKYEHG